MTIAAIEIADYWRGWDGNDAFSGKEKAAGLFLIGLKLSSQTEETSVRWQVTSPLEYWFYFTAQMTGGSLTTEAEHGDGKVRERVKRNHWLEDVELGTRYLAAAAGMHFELFSQRHGPQSKCSKVMLELCLLIHVHSNCQEN